jgi:spore germination protein GerM
MEHIRFTCWFLVLFCLIAGPVTDAVCLDHVPAVHGQDDVVFLYFADSKTGCLAGEKRKIEVQGKEKKDVSYYSQIVQAIIDGPNTGLGPTLPGQTLLNAVFVDTKGIIYVDLSTESSDLHPGGVRSELLSVYSIVNTLILNSGGIQGVQILVNGNQAETLAGHVDIRLPLNANMLLIR